MVMKTGDRWHCTNAACNCSVLVETTGEMKGKNPQCACGSVMKKQYSPPVFQCLDFVRFPDSVPASHESLRD